MANTPESQAAHFSSLLQQALALHQAGDLAAAAPLYEQVLGHFPNHADTLDLYGVLLHQGARNDAARGYLERAVQVRPDAAGFRNHLGACLRALGELDGAVSAFRRATELDPDMAEAWLNLASTLNAAGQAGAALEPARTAVEKMPDNSDARLMLAGILRELAHFAEAETELGLILAVAPLDPRIHLQLAESLRRRGEVRGSTRAARRGIVADPGAFEIIPLVSMTMAEAELDSAVRWAGFATVLEPADHRLWANLAAIAAEATENEKAFEAGRRCMLLDPVELTVFPQLIMCLLRFARAGEGRAWAYRGLSLHPGWPELRFVAGECEWILDIFENGWELYEARLEIEGLPQRVGLPAPWIGQDRCDGRLLVCAEQGVGDEYLFASCMPDLLKVEDQVIMECDERNIALFERSFSGVTCIKRQLRQTAGGQVVSDYQEVVERFDIARYVMAGSLMGKFRADPTLPAPPGGFLIADPIEAAGWNERLRAFGERPKVGLCWRSGVVSKVRDAYYSGLEQLVLGLGLRNDRATLVSLMYADTLTERDQIRDQLGADVLQFDGLDQYEELDRTAALISQLDLVVSADTSVCAQAAALGVPTIRLGHSYFHLLNGRDALFSNVYPCLDKEAPFEMDRIIEQARKWYEALIP
ncbi:MAG: tetratricopeptide repeat protein [Rhodospirillaceae bacterium]|nr:tetratricopeptide repeat protein [Rhodospirillaceae bacterium]